MKEVLYETAYSKVYQCYVKLDHTYLLSDGERAYWVSNTEQGISKSIHRESELKEFCL